MLKNCLTLIVLFLIVESDFVSAEEFNKIQEIRVKFVTSKELEQTLKTNVLVKKVEGVIVKKTGRDYYTLTYTLGRREPGDFLVGYIEDHNALLAPQDFRLRQDYASASYRPIVTYVNIFVTQTSLLGQAYVIDGGIGQPYITLLIEGYQTQIFDYRTQIYGI